MYLEIERNTIQDDYKAVAQRLEAAFGTKPIRDDIVPLRPATIESVDDKCAIVGAYGGLFLPPMRRWLFRQDHVTFRAEGVKYIDSNMKLQTKDETRVFVPDIFLYGRVNGFDDVDDAMLMRRFNIHAANLRNLLRVGQNGSFRDDGLYTVMINESHLREAIRRRQ